MSDVDKWIDIAKECKYLPENDLKVIAIARRIGTRTEAIRCARLFPSSGRGNDRARSATLANRLQPLLSSDSYFRLAPINHANLIAVRQKLCDIVCDLLLEESNIQPVSTPVTVCGDIHGQVSSVKNACSNLDVNRCVAPRPPLRWMPLTVVIFAILRISIVSLPRLIDAVCRLGNSFGLFVKCTAMLRTDTILHILVMCCSFTI